AVVPPRAARGAGARRASADPLPRRAPARRRQAPRRGDHAARRPRPRQRPGEAAPRDRDRRAGPAAPPGPAHRRGARLRDPPRGAQRLPAALRAARGRQALRGAGGTGDRLRGAADAGGAVPARGPDREAAREPPGPGGAGGARCTDRARGARRDRRGSAAPGAASPHGPHPPAAPAALLPRRPDPGGGPLSRPAPGARGAAAAAGPLPRLHRSGDRAGATVPQRAEPRRRRDRTLALVSTTPPADPAATAPAPRRARSGEVLVGPSVTARYLPGVLIGLP